MAALPGVMTSGYMSYVMATTNSGDMRTCGTSLVDEKSSTVFFFFF